jgi:hypothetical protein
MSCDVTSTAGWYYTREVKEVEMVETHRVARREKVRSEREIHLSVLQLSTTT